MVFLLKSASLTRRRCRLDFSFAYTVHKNFQKAIEAEKLNYTTDRRKEAAKKAWKTRRANAAVVK